MYPYSERKIVGFKARRRRRPGRLVFFAVQYLSQHPDRIGHNLCNVPLDTIPICIVAGAQPTFDIELGAFLYVFINDIRGVVENTVKLTQ